MRRSLRVAVAVAVGVAALAAPIVISVRLAWNQSLTGEKLRVMGYAKDTLRRTDEAGEEMESASARILSSGFAPCSRQEVDLMRQIDVTSAYIQAVGRIAGDQFICTSLGTTELIPLGPPSVVTSNGTTEWLRVKPIAGDHPVVVMAQAGIGFILEPALTLDTATEGPDVTMALYTPSTPDHKQLGTRNGQMTPGWFRSIPPGGKITFLDAGYVVAVARSATRDVAVVAAAPQGYALQRVRDFAATFVPIGIVCGIALAGAVVYISRAQLSMRSMIRAGARRKEFVVEYQPLVELTTGRWVGAEALVRWKRGGSMVRPDVFIPVAEENGIVPLITECVVDIVAADLPKLLLLDPEFRVAINLSAADLRSAATLDLMDRLIRVSGARTTNIEVEATERGFLQGEETKDILRELRRRGFCVAIDDFGTGYSSLSCLETLELDTLKIDKSFVDSLGTDGVTSHVVLHIIEIAHGLNLEMVAEGVETERQAESLRNRGVQYAQGWLYARPMSIGDLHQALRSRIDANAIE